MHLTNFGWLLIALLIFSLFIGYRYIKRSNPDEKPGCVGVVYVATICFILSLFVVMFAPALVNVVIGKSHLTIKGGDTEEESSLIGNILVGGSLLMIFIMFYCLCWGIAYALGKNTSRFMSIGVKILIYFIVPLGMLFMLFMLSRVVYRHAMGIERHETWAIGLCSFFSVGLFFGFWGYIKMLLRPKSADPGNSLYKDFDEDEDSLT